MSTEAELLAILDVRKIYTSTFDFLVIIVPTLVQKCAMYPLFSYHIVLSASSKAKATDLKSGVLMQALLP